MNPHPIQYCRRCGSAVVHRIPEDDTRERAVCPTCGEIQYVNPLIVVGTIPYAAADRRILLCQRAIEPRRGKWTLPAGFMEMDETMAEGALRETHEESGAEIRLLPLFSAFSIPRVGQVHFFYRAELLSEHLDPGVETLEAGFFTEDQIPWEEIAFRSVRQTLGLFFADLRQGQFGFHESDLT